MFTDGVATHAHEGLAQAAGYAASKRVGLYLIGIGDEQDLCDLRLHDLQVEDTIYLGDSAIFEVRLTGKGYKDLSLPILLKLRGKDGNEKEVARETVKVDPDGKSVRVKFRHKPLEKGPHKYIIEAEPPKIDPSEKPIPPSNLRLERVIEVIETEQIRVLYVEDQPRYEFRYLKFLLEREDAKQKKDKKRSIELKVLLLSADEDWPVKTDPTAIANFPPTLEELNKYNVLILGDCDPNHKQLKNRLKDIVHFARGEKEDGSKANKSGGGLLFLAGAFHNPHGYKGTPLAEVMPVEPLTDKPPKEVPRDKGMRPVLTPAGKMHPICRFDPNDGENLAIWGRLTPIYWSSSKYKTKSLAEVLLAHPKDKEEGENPGAKDEKKHPLIVQQFVGTGRSLFFGIDETWRWRRGEDESKFEHFWVQTLRYLSRGRPTRTTLRLDKQTPYRVGESIKVTVRFPDYTPGAGKDAPKIDASTPVKVRFTHTPVEGKEADPRKPELVLTKHDGSLGTYEGILKGALEGKYKFELTEPKEYAKPSSDGLAPSAEGIVEPLPGELERLRMNDEELGKAATTTNGGFYTLVNAENALRDVQRGVGSPIRAERDPTTLWNQWWVFALVVMLISAEWILRKMKHLL
jgi:uncharacterized membrane protein